MNVFTTRADLLGFISTHIVYKYIRRAIMDDGKVENLGAFSIPAKGFKEPGWVVKVTTPYKVVHYISVLCQEQYRLVVTNSEPNWKYWAGEGCSNEVYYGDRPDEYKKLKENANV